MKLDLVPLSADTYPSYDVVVLVDATGETQQVSLLKGDYQSAFNKLLTSGVSIGVCYRSTLQEDAITINTMCILVSFTYTYEESHDTNAFIVGYYIPGASDTGYVCLDSNGVYFPEW